MGGGRQAVLERIEKLMALSKSSNPNEAAVALSRAQKLMRENNITSGDLNLSSISEVTIETIPGLRRAAYVLRLAQITTQCFGLRYFFTNGRSGVASITIMGPKDRLDGASYVHVFLQRQLKAVLAAYRKQRRAELNRKYKLDNKLLADLIATYDQAAADSGNPGLVYSLYGSRFDYADGAIKNIVSKDLEDDSYSYVIGWLSSVMDKVQSYVVDEQEERLVLEYEGAKHPDLYKSSAGRSGRSLTRQFDQGVEDGRDGFDLLKGVGGVGNPELGYGG